MRRPIHTTNAIESLNFLLSQAAKASAHLRNDEAAYKLVDPSTLDMENNGHGKEPDVPWR